MPGPAESSEPLELAPDSEPAPESVHRLRPVGPPPDAGPPERLEAGKTRKTADKREKAARKPDLVSRFLDLPRWEQYAGAAALVCLLGWLGASGWKSFLSLGSPGGWFFTFALIGPLAVVFLIVAGTGPSRWIGVSDHARQRSLITFAVLPALGGAIELLQHFWAAVALVAALGMAYAAVRLALDKSDDQPNAK
jgi:hypothetical protein